MLDGIEHAVLAIPLTDDRQEHVVEVKRHSARWRVMMSKSSTPVAAHETHPVPGRIADSGAERASRVKSLLRERRRIALTFRRTQDDRDRAELQQIDLELAQYQIDIPAIQEQVAMRKQGIRKPAMRRAE
jgi:hypothetical protein